MAAAFTKALEGEVRYNSISPDAYRALGFPGAEDLGNMFQFKRDFNDAAATRLGYVQAARLERFEFLGSAVAAWRQIDRLRERRHDLGHSG